MKPVTIDSLTSQAVSKLRSAAGPGRGSRQRFMVRSAQSIKDSAGRYEAHYIVNQIMDNFPRQPWSYSEQLAFVALNKLVHKYGGVEI